MSGKRAIIAVYNFQHSQLVDDDRALKVLHITPRFSGHKHPTVDALDTSKEARILKTSQLQDYFELPGSTGTFLLSVVFELPKISDKISITNRFQEFDLKKFQKIHYRVFTVLNEEQASGDQCDRQYFALADVHLHYDVSQEHTNVEYEEMRISQLPLPAALQKRMQLVENSWAALLSQLCQPKIIAELTFESWKNRKWNNLQRFTERHLYLKRRDVECAVKFHHNIRKGVDRTPVNIDEQGYSRLKNTFK